MVPDLILKSDRILLRPFYMSDAIKLSEMLNKKIISETTVNVPFPYEQNVAEKWINDQATRIINNEYNFAIEFEDELIGSINCIVNKKFNHAEIGYVIGTDYWGNGFATEAVKLILRFAFESLKLNKVHAHHMINNPASGKVLLKNGFLVEGKLRSHVQSNGKNFDVITYGILRSDYFKTVTEEFKVSQLDHVEIFVPDRFAAAEWYNKNLGFEIIEDYKFWSNDPNGPLMISSDNGLTKIAFFEGEPQGVNKLCGPHLLAFSVNGINFIKLIDSLESRELLDFNKKRLSIDSISDHQKAYSIYFCDPWNTRLEIITYDYSLIKNYYRLYE